MTFILKSILSTTILITSMLIISCRNDLTIEQRYPMPWKDPNSGELIKIGRVLLGKGIKGCGEYYVRASSQDQGEYLISCTSNGTTWTYYLVWTEANEVIGPYSENTIEKPY